MKHLFDGRQASSITKERFLDTHVLMLLRGLFEQMGWKFVLSPSIDWLDLLCFEKQGTWRSWCLSFALWGQNMFSVHEEKLLNYNWLTVTTWLMSVSQSSSSRGAISIRPESRAMKLLLISPQWNLWLQQQVYLVACSIRITPTAKRFVGTGFRRMITYWIYIQTDQHSL